MREDDTPWRDAGLMFGRMFEDWSLEAGVFPPNVRVFAIASAGCTAMALAARGHAVTAVDLNPAQIAFVRARLHGAKGAEGSVDRQMARARHAMRLVGWTKPTLREFVSLDDPETQGRFWRSRLDTRRLRGALATLLSPITLRLFYPAPLARAVPSGFAGIVRRRLDRGFSTHPNRTNPYARLLLLGDSPPTVSPPHGTVNVVEAGAAEYLEACPARSFDAFTLSNILDAAEAGYARRLGAAIARAARPGAVVVMRSFAEPATPEEDRWARQDRALMWGSIKVSAA